MNNNCLKSITLDYASTGITVFEGGEHYIGEIYNNLPRGQGQLYMRDNSYYKGVFGERGMSYGIYKNSMGIVYEGRFFKDRLKKGSIRFPDGDVMEGEWKYRK